MHYEPGWTFEMPGFTAELPVLLAGRTKPGLMEFPENRVFLRVGNMESLPMEFYDGITDLFEYCGRQSTGMKNWKIPESYQVWLRRYEREELEEMYCLSQLENFHVNFSNMDFSSCDMATPVDISFSWKGFLQRKPHWPPWLT